MKEKKYFGKKENDEKATFFEKDVDVAEFLNWQYHSAKFFGRMRDPNFARKFWKSKG